MKKTVKTALSAMVIVASLAVSLTVISRQVAISTADGVMQRVIADGYIRFEVSPILWVDGKFQPQWWVRYTDPNRMIDFPPDVNVSLGGRVLRTSITPPIIP